jgi:uncharacterized Zn finger protein
MPTISKPEQKKMVELINADQLSKAIARAKAGRLFVQATSIFRQYRVTNRETGAQYVVDFFVRNGKRYGHCSCLAGQNNKQCKHLVAAVSYHLYVAALRRTVTAH